MHGENNLSKAIDLLDQENKVISVDGVNGPEIILGSMSDVSTSGNWPTTYDSAKE